MVAELFRNYGLIRRFGLLIVLLLVVQAAHAATFIAPEPPESVLLKGPSERGSKSYRIFLSKRAPEEIRAFYEATLGPFSSRLGSEHGAESRVIVTYQQAVDILLARHRDVTLADDLKVQIDWKPLRANHAVCTGDFFQQLMIIARVKKRQSEFDTLCKEYGYLENAWFQKVLDPGRGGQWIDADKEILARGKTEHGGKQAKSMSVNSAELARRMQELTMSGRTAEARALAEQVKRQAAETTDSAYDWDAWVKVLKEGDAMAYRTWIFLPTHPSTW